MVVLQALVGHQYGPALLPTQVEVSEYQLLLQENQKAGVCTRQLERAYQRDENAVPPSYRLTASVKSTCSPLVITSLFGCVVFLIGKVLRYQSANKMNVKINVCHDKSFFVFKTKDFRICDIKYDIL